MQHVDDAGELVLRADREVHGDALLGELLVDRRQRAEEVCALAVEHVHEQQARKSEVGGARPLAAGAHLGAHDAREDEECALDDPESGDRVTLEAGIAGRVDQVDLALLPLEVRERGGERHLALLLVVVPVGDGRAGFDRAGRFTIPVWKSSASTSDVLPTPRCPTTATLRIFSGS